MRLLKNLWQDTSGSVITAEAVLVGSVGVVAAITGINAARDSLDAELEELSYAIRSLDQSYTLEGHSNGSAWTARSSYLQPDVNQSLAELKAAARGPAKPLGRSEHLSGEATASGSSPERMPIAPAPEL